MCLTTAYVSENNVKEFSLKLYMYLNVKAHVFTM